MLCVNIFKIVVSADNFGGCVSRVLTTVFELDEPSEVVAHVDSSDESGRLFAAADNGPDWGGVDTTPACNDTPYR